MGFYSFPIGRGRELLANHARPYGPRRRWVLWQASRQTESQHLTTQSSHVVVAGQVLGERSDRMATVRSVLADLTDEQLAGVTRPVTEPGYPELESFPVRRCLRAILNEEWQHRLYAERDLDALQRQPG